MLLPTNLDGYTRNKWPPEAREARPDDLHEGDTILGVSPGETILGVSPGEESEGSRYVGNWSDRTVEFIGWTSEGLMRYRTGGRDSVHHAVGGPGSKWLYVIIPTFRQTLNGMTYSL